MEHELTGRRVARLKGEHRDLKARFDRAKAESQMKVRSLVLVAIGSQRQY